MSRTLIVEADGGSRGNPGPAAGGAVVIDAATGEILAEVGSFVGVATNNLAEYRGMIDGCALALEIAPDAQLDVRMDSKLVVEQMSGRWKIKHPSMADLAQEARALLQGVPVRFTWVPRAENARADAVANRVMDSRSNIRTVLSSETPR